MHLILQNGQQLPRPLQLRLYDAIEEHNKSKQRNDQRPNWGIHMTEAHVLAIADTHIPSNFRTEGGATTKAKAKAAPKPSVAAGARSTPSTSSTHPGAEESAQTQKQPPKAPPWIWKGGKDHGTGGQSYSHRGGDWNYTGQYRGR